MELWVVAAAAGAGYVVKYLQQITSKEKEDSSEPVSGDLVVCGQSDSRKLALPLPKLGQKQSGIEDVWDEQFPEISISGVAGPSGAGSNCNVLSLMNLSTNVNTEKGLIQISRPMNIRNRSVGYLVKQPMNNSLESCLKAQLGKECTRRAWRVSGLEEEIGSRLGSIELPVTTQRRSSRLSEGTFHSQGSPNGLLLFFLGITIGILSSAVSNPREMDNKSENLVQDLHAELETKEFSTTKELTSKDYESPTDKHSDEQEVYYKPSEYDGKETGNEGAEKAELMNKIEAELEAELEKLELSMNVARLERISKLVELDHCFEADVVQGELQIDRADGYDSSGASTADIDAANHAVPPMELSLRLHEVIKLRLEARVMELEGALESSEQRRRSIESDDRTICSRMFCCECKSESESELESLSTEESPTCKYGGCESEQPVIMMDLSGESLAACNEAYEDMYRMTETDDEISLEIIRASDHIREVLNPENSEDDDISQYGNMEERCSRKDVMLDKLRTQEKEEEMSRSWGSNDLGEEDDEIEKLIMKLIVERTKQGSPVILNAQKSCISMNDE